MVSSRCSNHVIYGFCKVWFGENKSEARCHILNPNNMRDAHHIYMNIGRPARHGRTATHVFSYACDMIKFKAFPYHFAGWTQESPVKDNWSAII